MFKLLYIYIYLKTKNILRTQFFTSFQVEDVFPLRALWRPSPSNSKAWHSSAAIRPPIRVGPDAPPGELRKSGVQEGGGFVPLVFFSQAGEEATKLSKAGGIGFPWFFFLVFSKLGNGVYSVSVSMLWEHLHVWPLSPVAWRLNQNQQTSSPRHRSDPRRGTRAAPRRMVSWMAPRGYLWRIWEVISWNQET